MPSHQLLGLHWLGPGELRLLPVALPAISSAKRVVPHVESGTAAGAQLFWSDMAPPHQRDHP